MIISMYKQAIEKVDDLEAFLDRDVVKKAIGKNYDFYRELWLQHDKKIKGELKKVGLKGRINWLAALYIPAWYGYRKMHSAFWILLGLLSILVFYETYNDLELLKSTTGMFLFLAILSRATYMGELIDRVKKYDSLPNKERKEAYARIHLGTSKKLAWIYGITYVMVIFIVAIIADSIRPV